MLNYTYRSIITMPEKLIKKYGKKYNKMLKIHLWVLRIHIQKKKQNTYFFFITSLHWFNWKMNIVIVIVFLTKQLIEAFTHFLLPLIESENPHLLSPPASGAGCLFFRPLETFLFIRMRSYFTHCFSTFLFPF